MIAFFCPLNNVIFFKKYAVKFTSRKGMNQLRYIVLPPIAGDKAGDTKKNAKIKNTHEAYGLSFCIFLRIIIYLSLFIRFNSDNADFSHEYLSKIF